MNCKCCNLPLDRCPKVKFIKDPVSKKKCVKETIEKVLEIINKEKIVVNKQPTGKVEHVRGITITHLNGMEAISIKAIDRIKEKFGVKE